MREQLRGFDIATCACYFPQKSKNMTDEVISFLFSLQIHLLELFKMVSDEQTSLLFHQVVPTTRPPVNLYLSQLCFDHWI